MATRALLTRLLYVPFHASLAGGRVEAVDERVGEVAIDYDALVLDAPPSFASAADPRAGLRGQFVPRRLALADARVVRRTGIFDAWPPADEPGRHVLDVFGARPPGQEPRVVVVTDSAPAPSALVIVVRGAWRDEARPQTPRPVALERAWIPAPAPPGGPVYRGLRDQARHGGDAVPIRLGRRLHHRRLFVGGLDHQGAMRPDVDHVLNLSEHANPWPRSPGHDDRHAPHGEGRDGLSPEALAAEAAWVRDRLAAGRRVLVHCNAGVNRSSTVCCAALGLLEGLAPTEALARVRLRHREARPDAFHWLALHALAHP